ncbi:MAG: hypothetical protein M0Z67_10130 [Nitrospiraceae bacterium]|nr:hypothetical protein [Nitrospiraceae bacterium]
MTDKFHNGQVVHHKVLGTGRVVNIEETRLVVDFIRGGVKLFDPSAAADELSDGPYQEEGGRDMEMDELKDAIREVLREEGLVGAAPRLAAKWEGGEMVLKPGKPDLQGKTVPIDTFFHKIVIVRNQLRVLEQNINSHKNLTDAEKADLQQYITRCYGSLTTFNALFADKSDWFVGARRDD